MTVADRVMRDRHLFFLFWISRADRSAALDRVDIIVLSSPILSILLINPIYHQPK